MCHCYLNVRYPTIPPSSLFKKILLQSCTYIKIQSLQLNDLWENSSHNFHTQFRSSETNKHTRSNATLRKSVRENDPAVNFAERSWRTCPQD